MDQEKFPREEFAKQRVKRGYANYSDGGKQAVLKWCKEHPKEFYTESDMLDVYRYFNTRKVFHNQPKQGGYYDWAHDPM